VTREHADDFGDPSNGLTDADVDAYATDVRELPTDDRDSPFPPAVPTDRDDPYNAYVTPFVAESADRGPLRDVRIAIKDNLAIGGVRMTAGTDAIAVRPDEDARVVERLRRAGGTLTETTNMDALALGTTGESSAHGRTKNPVVPDHVPGGSSSGSAAAVAGGLIDAAIGTDTGGSVRIPASFCGLVGFKPTRRLVPRSGVAPLAPSLDHVGVLASDVETAAAVVETIGGGDRANPATIRAPAPGAVDFTSTMTIPPTDCTIGIAEEFVDAATTAVGSTVRRAVSTVATARDYSVELVSIPDYDGAWLVNDAQTLMEFADVLSLDGRLVGAGAWSGDPWPDAVRGLLEHGLPSNDHVRGSIDLGRRLLDRHGRPLYTRAWAARHRFYGQVDSAFESVDVLATPTTPLVAPAFGAVPGTVDVRETLRNTAPFNNTGQPSISVPCGRTRGVPVGLQLTTPHGTDAFAARVARVFEAVLDVE
jgi:Asp-tRNA(Asn)/Glu-tRNA(Gln) amidotransferase A subunit family amidase